MEIEKLKSGSYRIRQMYNGKRYSTTIDHKPTQKEATLILAKLMEADVSATIKGTFKDAATKYIDAKKNVLSPRSVREYRLYIDRLPAWFVDLPSIDVGQLEVQRCVNELALNKSPKTVRCLHGFISAVMGLVKPSMKLSTTLPQKVKNEPYIPTEEEVKKLLQYTDRVSPMFYVPIALAASGLRRSEILALTIDDLSDRDIISINKATVEDEEGEWIDKTTKTTASTRTVPISPDLANRIREQGYIYKGAPQSISNFMKRAEEALGMPEFSIHKLRHFYASVLLANGVSMKDVQALGGWETDATLKEVYAHAMKARTEDAKREINAQVWKSIF